MLLPIHLYSLGGLERRRRGIGWCAAAAQSCAVGRRRARGGVDDRPVLGAALGERARPSARRGGARQHLARGRARLAERRPRGARAGAAAGDLEAELAGCRRRGARGVLHVDARRIDLELLGDEHGVRGHRALPHLHAVEREDHPVVGGDAQPRVGREVAGARVGCAAAVSRGRAAVAAGQDQARAPSPPSGERPPPRRNSRPSSAVRSLDLELPGPAPAARWMARRMRGYVPQRQRLARHHRVDVLVGGARLVPRAAPPRS